MSLKVLYKAIAYLRLSKEDGDEAESNSIRNQRILIEDYVKRQADIKLIGEKVDDGYSGVNFDRPGFQEMMELIRDGKVNCVIVKDLSRFARNFVESGKYLQQIFPFLNVRFIAINDNYDSLKADYQTNNLYEALIRQNQMEMEVKAIVQNSKARREGKRGGKAQAHPQGKKRD